MTKRKGTPLILADGPIDVMSDVLGELPPAAQKTEASKRVLPPELDPTEQTTSTKGGSEERAKPTADTREMAQQKMKVTYNISESVVFDLEEAWVNVRRMRVGARPLVSKSRLIEVAVGMLVDDLKKKGVKSVAMRHLDSL